MSCATGNVGARYIALAFKRPGRLRLFSARCSTGAERKPDEEGGPGSPQDTLPIQTCFGPAPRATSRAIVSKGSILKIANFDTQPRLQNDLITARPLRVDDFAALFELASDPLLWEQHPARDRYQEPVFRAFFDDALKSGGALLVQDRRTGASIGTSRYAALDTQRSEVEIGWTFLARACWGGRFNARLKSLMLQHAFRYVESVIFDVGAANFRSQKAVLKLGATLDLGATSAYGAHGIRYRLTRSAALAKKQAG